MRFWCGVRVWGVVFIGVEVVFVVLFVKMVVEFYVFVSVVVVDLVNSNVGVVVGRKVGLCSLFSVFVLVLLLFVFVLFIFGNNY